jgi:hypothetical protein
VTLSAFSDKSHQPSDADLRKVLGKAYQPWAHLIAAIAERIAPLTQVWGFTSSKTGWGLRLRHEQRVILYMTPQCDQFLVSLVLGEKAVAAAQAQELPAAMLKSIEEAPKYAEGRAFRVAVTRNSQIAPLAALALVKHQN